MRTTKIEPRIFDELKKYLFRLEIDTLLEMN